MHVKKQCTLTDEGGFEGFEGEDGAGQGFEGKGDNWHATEHATGGGGGLHPLQPPPLLSSSKPPFFKPNEPSPWPIGLPGMSAQKRESHTETLLVA